MQIKEIREMIRLVSQSGLSVFEMENDGFRIRMENGGSVVATDQAHVSQANNNQAVDTLQADSADIPQTATEQRPQAQVTGTPVKAPLVGVFYESPSPDKPAYVKVGDSVAKGDVLCIIEAMKVMNEITAEKDGVIKQILVENEQLVEYGQDLFTIG